MLMTKWYRRPRSHMSQAAAHCHQIFVIWAALLQLLVRHVFASRE